MKKGRRPRRRPRLKLSDKAGPDQCPVPGENALFPAQIAGFLAVSRAVPVYPVFLNYVVPVQMDELGIRSMGAYLRKMALDGYCIRLDLQDVKALVSLLRICSNNLNQYAKRANETGSIYRADIEDLQKRLEEIWTDMREVLVRLSSIQ